ncbi:histone deacetylase [Ktedonosporobacter rubrisoli]|uniref:Histone deacetylase n=1 Tax=Ktedonosporobacter rubrisoli TaxID=2509675 RepID=A0A4P6K216_KTERU|nr:histone deacetylase [Ktedonosporobacter rubrisoli]QBD82237.1 histone deacetylase [Ktedonosporobacter rubrisoli]
MTTALIYDPIFLEHITPSKHPEKPQRVEMAIEVIKALNWLERDGLVQLAPRAATVDELATIHEREYIQEVEAASKNAASASAAGGPKTHFFATDTYVSAKSYEAALKAAGAPLVAIDAIMKGEINNAYCLVRPPGHHAVPESAMGFCLFNNVAVAARYAIDHYGLERVMIIDYDVHHGNGTQEVFYDDPRVLYFSVHQAPFYPGTGLSTELGEGPGLGTTINVPLPAKTPFIVYESVFRRVLVPAADRFNPQLILVSAGYDAHWDDPLGDMYLSTAAFAKLNTILVELANQLCDGRMIMVQEGGYSLEAMAACVATSVNQLLGDDAALDNLGQAPDVQYYINIDVLIAELRRIHNLTGYRPRHAPKPDIERIRREVKGPEEPNQE